jgi:hypothetical protein
VQSEPGLYLVDRFAFFSASTLKDAGGATLPVPGLDAEARANMFGFGFTAKPRHAPYLSIAAGVPLADVSLSVDRPLAATDRSGFGDIFVQPLKLGWRQPRFDIVASYTFYAPTGKFEPRRLSVGRGFWTHQFSAGGAVFSKPDRRWRTSALLSYDLNGRKREIDIRRGNTMQVQGGVSYVASQVVVLGLAGYGLWQVTDDQGADIPDELRGLRTRGFGLGPELTFNVLPMRLQGELRWEHELASRSRLAGDIIVAGLSYRAWQPRPQKASR